MSSADLLSAAHNFQRLLPIILNTTSVTNNSSNTRLGASYDSSFNSNVAHTTFALLQNYMLDFGSTLDHQPTQFPTTLPKMGNQTDKQKIESSKGTKNA